LNIYYLPSVVAVHPHPLRDGYGSAEGRAFRYGAGIGRVWRKHHFPPWLVAYYLLRPVGGAILGLLGGNWPRTRYHWNAFRGRLRGWWPAYSFHTHGK
jgi:hypothetical protein